VQINFGLRLPSEVATVPVVRRLCGTTMRELLVEEGCVADVLLVLTEACANVIEHASGTEDEYEVRLQLSGDWVDIRVVDTGGGFDAESLADGMPDPTADRGRGIELMRALVDRLRFESRPERGTIVRFEKRLELAADSPLNSLGGGERRQGARGSRGEV
jgi:serine/threonine-protein kinase RsbW